MLTDNTGANNANLRRYDYLPFGQQIPSGVDGRTTGMGYTITPDVTDPKFTGEYRDPETTLDWLAVRAMSGAQGRFQSVDPDNAGALAGDPQTWNAYAYVGNNPLSYIDRALTAARTKLPEPLFSSLEFGSGAALAVGAIMVAIELALGHMRPPGWEFFILPAMLLGFGVFASIGRRFGMTRRR